MRYDQYDEVTTAPGDAQILLNRPSTTSGTYPSGTPAWITPGNLLTDSDAVLSVNGAGPDGDGNVLLAAADVGALAPDGDGSALTGITHGQVSGLGSAALAATSAFDAAGAAASEATRAEAAEALLAPKASPAFTDNPTAPTQTSGDSSTKLATTAFVADAVSGAGGSFDISGLTAKTSAADADELPLADSADSGNPKKATVAVLAKAFYRGALLVLPDPSNVAATNVTLVNSALSAAASAGIGVVKCAPVAWNWAGGTVLHDGSGLKLDLEGCTITGSGSGALIEMYDSIAFESRTIHGGGVDGDPWIDGSAMTGASYAVHMGDIFEAVCNVRAIGFNADSASKGVWFDNRYAICEALHARIFTSGCKAGVVFDVNSGATATGAHVNATGSYMRSDLDLHVNQGDPGNDGIVFQNGAFLVDGVKLAIHGNYGTSASALTSAVVRVTGSTPTGITAVTASTIETTPFSWGMENDGSDANAPYTIFFGGDSNFIRNCTGVAGFGSGTSFKTSNNAGQFLGFVGVVTGDANLPSALAQSSTNAADGSQAISATSATAITNVLASVAAFTAYEVDAYIPHTGAGTSGTFTFALGGPSISTGNTSLDVEQWTTTTLTAAIRNGTSATLDARPPSTSARVLRVRGTLVCSASGTLTITGAKTSGGSNVTVAAGAYLKLTPMAAP